MPSANTYQKPRWINVPRSLSGVHAVQDYSDIRVDVTKLAGVPSEFIIEVAHAYNSGREDGKFHRGGTAGLDNHRQTIENILASYASRQPPDGSYRTCPLFWLLRVRWYLRTATLPLLRLQQHDPYANVYRSLQSYRALAFWHCGAGRIQDEWSPLYSRLLKGTRLEANERNALHEPATRHRLLWLADAWGVNRSAIWQDILAACDGYYWKPTFPPFPVVERSTAVWFQESWRRLGTPKFDTEVRAAIRAGKSDASRAYARHAAEIAIHRATRRQLEEET